MKLLIVLALVAVALARPEETYDSKYNDFNVDEVIGNKRLLEAHTHCFIGDGKCTAEGNDIKKMIPESISSSCGKCTPKQKVLVAKTMKAIKTKLPTEYGTLIKIHDPDNKYAENLEAFIAEYSV